MPRARRTRRRRTWSLALPLLVAGCASGPAPRDHFYRLEIPAPQTKLEPAPLDGTVEVDRLRADALTRERTLLYRVSSGDAEVRRHTYHQWIDSPTLLIQRQLVEFLREAGAARQVVTPEMRVKPDLVIDGRLLELQQIQGGGEPHVVVGIELTLTRIDDRTLLVHETYREQRPTAGVGVSAAVDSFGAALESIFERFLADAGAP
jgi:ABC-type uncharacterized transport system auxiliary subunit